MGAGGQERERERGPLAAALSTRLIDFEWMYQQRQEQLVAKHRKQQPKGVCVSHFVEPVTD